MATNFKSKLRVGQEINGVEILEIGEGHRHSVRCARCQRVYTMATTSLEKRRTDPTVGCTGCRENNPSGTLLRPHKGCRTCDDCPALRPESGCPACGEPGAKVRAA